MGEALAQSRHEREYQQHCNCAALGLHQNFTRPERGCLVAVWTILKSFALKSLAVIQPT